MPTALQTLITSIPTAETGHVIATNYHNSLRAAVAAMANKMEETTTFMYAPVFFPDGQHPPWTAGRGMASKPAGGTGRGWFPLQLPDGARIVSVRVVGSKAGTVTSFQVQLQQMPFPGSSASSILSVSLIDEPSGAFDITRSVPASTPVVDNSANKYLIWASVVGAGDPADVADLYAIGVTVSRA